MDQAPLITELLASGLAHCRTIVVDQQGLLLSLFLAGLLGSVTHCVGMCGPFVVAQVTAPLETVPANRISELQRLGGAALLPYHLGRATTYVALGAVAAGLADGLASWTGLKWLSTALLLLAAALFIGYAIRYFGVILPRNRVSENGWWSRVFGRRLTRLFDRPLGWRGYGLGMALGFLPCGLLYAALAAAAAGGGATAGAFAMMAFSLGTMPMLIVVAVAGHLAGQHWRELAYRTTPVLMVFNAGLLSYLAWRSAA